MPLYEYACQECGRQTELLVSTREEPRCPACGGERLTKLLSVVARGGREASADRPGEGPAGPCGAMCGCFPPG